MSAIPAGPAPLPATSHADGKHQPSSASHAPTVHNQGPWRVTTTVIPAPQAQTSLEQRSVAVPPRTMLETLGVAYRTPGFGAQLGCTVVVGGISGLVGYASTLTADEPGPTVGRALSGTFGAFAAYLLGRTIRDVRAELAAYDAQRSEHATRTAEEAATRQATAMREAALEPVHTGGSARRAHATITHRGGLECITTYVRRDSESIERDPALTTGFGGSDPTAAMPIEDRQAHCEPEDSDSEPDGADQARQVPGSEPESDQSCSEAMPVTDPGFEQDWSKPLSNSEE